MNGKSSPPIQISFGIIAKPIKEERAILSSDMLIETRDFQMVQTSSVVGNESIHILKHRLEYRNGVSGVRVPVVEIAMRNISEITVSNVVFEAVFYDSNDEIIDIVKHNEIEFKPQTSRAFGIPCPTGAGNRVKGYQIRISRMAKSSEEKVQLRQHKISTGETGEEEISGIVKNISTVMTNAVLVASFLDKDGEKIGAKAIFMKNIEPDSYRRFHFVFRPAQGDQVMTYTLSVISDIEEC